MAQEPPIPDPAQGPVSALDFALSQPSPPEAALPDLASVLAADHRLLTKEGRVFVTNASTLTDEQRATLKASKPTLATIAEPWPDGLPFPEMDTPRIQVGQSLADFLGSAPVRSNKPYTPDEIPSSLDGISDLVLNFATTGLEWVKGARPCGVTISTLDGALTRFLPFAFRGGEGNLDEEVVKRFVREQVRGKKLHNANMGFDMHQSRCWGVDLEELGNTFTDIQHTAALIDDHRRQFNLDLLAKDFLPEVVPVPRVDENRHADYAPAEVAEREHFTAQIVGHLTAVMYPMLDAQDLRPVQHLEDEVIPAVVEMEKNGAPINMELLEQYGTECMRRHDALLWEIAQEVGFAFDHSPSSWKKLFEHYNLPISYLPETEKRGANKETYADGIIATIDHPVVQKARLAGQLSSLNSKTFKPYREMIGSDGILHYTLNQLRGDEGGTVTGRFSAGFIQQVPNHGNHFAVFGEELFPRRLYLPGSGEYLAADAAQIQYRIFAHHANNPRIMKMYADDPKASFHKMIMKLLVPFKPDLIYEHLKSMNFMIIFGGGLIKIAVMMGYITTAEGEEIRKAKAQKTDPRLAQAREIQAIYDREIKEVGPLLRMSMHLAMNECDVYCNKTFESQKLHQQYSHRGYVKTVMGRRSRFPNNYKIYKAFCMVDQGSEGDIMKAKIVELHKARKETGFLMRQTVHDEVSGDALAPDTKSKVDAILNRQSFPQIRVPILFEVNTGKTWADCK